MRMPGMNGYEATERIKANPSLKAIPVIAVTASSFREEEARARKVCDGFIRKPFNRSELIAEFKRFLKLSGTQDTKRVPGDDTSVASASAVASTAALVRRPELLAKLREEEERVLPRLLRTMDMGEIEEFARRLGQWAVEGEWSKLREFASALLQQVEAFDVDQLPRTLQNFSNLCGSLAAQPISPS